MTPAPGWYPDPHAPHLERWWDGTAWSEHRRTPEAPGGPVPTPPGGTGGRTRAIALATAAAVLVAAVVTGAVLLGGDDGDPETRTGPSTAPSAPSPDGDGPAPSVSASASEPSADDPNTVEDQLNGVTFPLLDGWVRPENVSRDDVVMTTPGTHDCPGEGSACRHGLVISRTMTGTDETSPELLAEEDVSDAAEDAFEEDALDQSPYGGIESHTVLKSGPVAVAGRAGYYVRWQVTTGRGPGGYVQSLVFPSTVGTGAPVAVRYVFEAGDDAPPLADMDRITKGIRAAGDAGPGGGVGNSVGPAS
ncbi:DUF2510 domain-containing protein [Streptomyces sp. NEAU-W12]|uniref:DUF2510 domain-containing protein n=1 Tax=Streptomyces sp. NEAU-W12 TaxID=2994668 RepID=UPI00224AA3AE|nr:DUF2510 domain-containing protein [Streptomyces sp. NEAU-W12]MCX2928162.1 DUF2510 domain-containing protein [Streptomyces sp. NEAU-W12]